MFWTQKVDYSVFDMNNRNQLKQGGHLIEHRTIPAIWSWPLELDKLE